MDKKELGVWKKAFVGDLDYIANECKNLVAAQAVLFLEGPVGAGKTTFAKVFIGEEGTMSPSYSVVNESGKYLHADFYRIKDLEEIVHLELPLYLEDKNFFVIEWGLQYSKTLINEIPDEFKFYLLEITPTEESRTFTLFELTD